MAYAIARLTKPHTEPLCGTIQKQVIIGFLKSFCTMLWSTYWHETSVLARVSPIASSSNITMVPVASCDRV